MKFSVATLVLSPVLFACSAMPLDEGGPADIAGDTKTDGGPGIEVMARITPGTTDAVLSMAVPRLGYVFYAAEDSDVTFEVTHGGSDMGLDTVLKLYGPRLQNGQYIKTFATDEDSGYGKLSRIKKFHIPVSGFYLIEMSFGAAATPYDGAHARLAFSCEGTCDTTDPIVPIDEGMKWYRRSAERRALTMQGYKLATAKLQEKLAANTPANWGVVLDVDETTLNNSQYQQSRLDLGVGFSPGSWTAWVNQRAATPIDGVVDFTNTVKALGGTVALVTNRKAVVECPQTEDNLRAVGVAYDAIFCQVDVSDKNPRFQAIQNGTTGTGLPALTVLEFVGDNIQDFPALTQDLRKMDASAYAAFGEDYFVIPNPMYGSFDKNLDANPM
jgi:5'-nucleotidase (lipoprotein e(P4) family)